MIDISKNILDKPARRWRLVDEHGGSVYRHDGGDPNEIWLCHREFYKEDGESLSALRRVVYGTVLLYGVWYDLLLESVQWSDFRHITGLVDGIGVSELWAIDRLASRDDEPAMRARKRFTPAQRAVVQEWHKRELAMLARERA